MGHTQNFRAESKNGYHSGSKLSKFENQERLIALKTLRHYDRKVQQRKEQEMKKLRQMKAEYQAQMFSSPMASINKAADAIGCCADAVTFIVKKMADSHVIEKAVDVVHNASAFPTKVLDKWNLNLDDMSSALLFTILRILSNPTLKVVIIEICDLLNRFTHVFSNGLKFIMDQVYPFLEKILSKTTLLTKITKQGRNCEEPAIRYTAQGVLDEVIDKVTDFNWVNLVPFGAGLSALLGSAILGREVVGSARAFAAFSKWSKFGSDISKAKSGIKTVMDFVVFVIEQTKTFCMEYFPGKFIGKGAIGFFKSKYGFCLVQFIKEVAILTNPANREKIFGSRESRNQVDKLMHQGALVSVSILKEEIKLAPGVAQQMSIAISDLKKFCVTFDDCESSTATRFCPFVVALYGQPGCGKSVMTDVLVRALTDPENIKVPFDRENLMYARNMTDKYWSKYNGQQVIILDDFGQKANPTVTESEYMEFISCVSSVPWSVTMAAVEDKGKRFKGKLIILTTNDPHPQPHEVKSYKAVWRRRNILVEVVGKPGAEDEALTDVNNRCTFNLRDPLENDVSKNLLKYKGTNLEDLTFEDLVAYICPRFQKYYDNFNETKDSVTYGKIDLTKYVAQVKEEKGFLPEGVHIIDGKVTFVHNGPITEEFKAFAEANGLRNPVEHGMMVEFGEFIENAHGGLCPQYNGNLEYGVCCIPEGDEEPARDHFLTNIEDFQALFCVHLQQFVVDGVPIDWREHNLGENEQMDWILLMYSRINLGIMGEEDWMMEDDFMIRIGWSDDEARANFESYKFIELNGFVNLVAQAFPAYDPSMNPFEEEESDSDEESLEYLDSAEEAFEGMFDEQEKFTFLEGMKEFAEVYPKVSCAIYGLFSISAGILACTGIYKAYQWMFPGVKEGIAVPSKDAIDELVSKFPAKERNEIATYLRRKRAEGLYMAEMGSGDHRTLHPRKVARFIRRSEFEKQKPIVPEGEEFKIVDDESPEWHAIRSIVSQGTSDPNAVDLVRNKLPKNLLVLTCVNDEGKVRRIRALGLVDRLMIVPYHFLSHAVGKDLPVTIRSVHGDHTTYLLCKKMQRLKYMGELLDAVIVEASNIAPFQSIIKNVISENDIDKVIRIPSVLTGLSHVRETPLVQQTMEFESVSLSQMAPIEYDAEKEVLSMHKGYNYRIQTVYGDCGSVLVAINPMLQGKIIGFHVAGSADKADGFSLPLIREVLEETLKKFPHEKVTGYHSQGESILNEQLDEYEIMKKARVFPSGDIGIVGLVHTPHIQRFPEKTDIRPSCVHDMLTRHTTEPAVLTPSDPRIDWSLVSPDYTPMTAGVNKYSVPCQPFNPSDVELAVKLVSSQLALEQPAGMVKRLLTLHEMINGIPGVYKRIDMHTSSGLFYKNYNPPGQKGKFFCFKRIEETEDYEIDTDTFYQPNNNMKPLQIGQYLLDRINENEGFMREGLIPEWILYSNLKQERKELSKIACGKTRTFECCPLDLSLLFRKYFGAFIATMNANCTKLPSAVGIDPEGPAWTRLYQRMVRFGGQVLAGDYKCWDGMLSGDVMLACAKIVSQWYDDGPINARVRNILIEVCIRANILCCNVVLKKFQGIPSGVPITADFNSLCNWVYMTIIFIELSREHKFNWDLGDFPGLFEFTFYGDDHIVAPHPSIQHFFNFHNVRDAFARKGITYTDALKTGVDPLPLEDMTNITYLKRRFAPAEGHPSRILAPIEMNTIDEEINWIRARKGVDEVAATLENIDSARRDLFQHGRQVYNAKMKQINDVIAIKREEDFLLGSDSRWKSFVIDYDFEFQRWNDNFV